MSTSFLSHYLSTPRRAVSGRTDRVVVVGAGLSGLAAAVLLAGSGRSVTVVEREDHVGGRAATETISTPLGDVRIDTGATVVTMPWLVDEILASVGLSTGDLTPDFSYQRLSPAYHALFSSGRYLDVFAEGAGEEDAQEAIARGGSRLDNEIRRFAREKFDDVPHRNGDAPRDEFAESRVTGVRGYRLWAQSMFDACFSHLMNADFDSVWDLVRTRESARSLARVARRGGFGSLGRAAERYISDDELRKVFSFQALYAGVPPKKARAVYATISHMDTGMGVFYPTRGPHGSGVGALCDILAAALKQSGGELMLNTRVTSLSHASHGAGSSTTHSDRIHVVETTQGTLPADVVITTCDIPELDAISGRQSRRTTRWSPSAFVMHGAIPREVTRHWPGGHHTISFGKEWDRTFSEITAPHGRGRLMSDPSLLVTRPACSAPDLVSTSTTSPLVPIEPVSVLAPCPNTESAHINWSSLAASYQEDLLSVLEDRGFEGIRESFAVGKVDTPDTWSALGLGAGTPFAPAHLFRQTGPFRFRNFPVRSFSNLIHAGSSTTPGVGVPTVILSGALAAARITRGDHP